MIRECTETDREILVGYLEEDSYGQAIFHLIDEFGFEQKFQSVYMDIEEEQCKGVYLMIYKNVLLYSKENQVEIDFLEQMLSVLVPEMVIGRKDNVNIVSWLLTDYRMDTVDQSPGLCEGGGEAWGGGGPGGRRERNGASCIRRTRRAMKRIFIDGLSGMAQGLFATLIIGTIIQQIGMFVGGNYGDLIYLIGKVAAAFTGAGIGVGVARKLEAQQLVTVCAAVVGMIGAFAGKILAGQVLVDGNIVLAGPGEPLGAFVAAYVAIEIGILVTGRTKLDIILTPLICIGVGAVVGLFVGPPISSFFDVGGFFVYLGNRTAAVPYGNCSFGLDGNDPDIADQLRGFGGNPESVRSCSWSSYSWMLLQYDWIRSCKL